jgi:radical SAM/Cys-rich protein
MSEEIAARCITLLKETPSIHTLDITGGAPELNESFRYIVAMAREFRPELDIIDRCNLTVLQEPGQDDLVDFLVEHKVHVIASLPCYSADNVDKQRGNGVFDRSISALLALNESGYGIPNSELMLDLVYNPLGAFLPPSQEMLEAKYKEELAQNFGIVFNSLYTMTNIPVKRFTDFLYNRGELKDYMDLLVRNFNPDTMDNLMCGNTVSVGYDGKVFDCDFNQQLGYTIGSDKSHEGGKTVFDIESLTDLKCDAIKNDNHCFGCTAGNGSS